MELLQNILFEVIIVLFTMYLYTRYLTKIDLPKRSGWIIFPFWILFFLVQIVMAVLETTYPVINLAINAILFLGILITNYKLKIMQYLRHFILYYGLWTLVEVLSTFFISYTAALDYEYASMEGSLLSGLFMCFATPLVLQYREYKKKKENLPSALTLLKFSLVPIGSFYLSTYIFLTSTDYAEKFSFLIFTLFVLIINYLSYDAYEKTLLPAGSFTRGGTYTSIMDFHGRQTIQREAAYMENKRRRNTLNEYLSDIKSDLRAGKISDADSKVNVIVKKNRIYNGDISKSGNITIDSLINHKYGLFKKYNIKAEESVFLDDLAANIEGAKRVGMHGIVFTGIEEAKEALKALGVEFEM